MLALTILLNFIAYWEEDLMNSHHTKLCHVFYNIAPDSHMTTNAGNIVNYYLKMTLYFDLC